MWRPPHPPQLTSAFLHRWLLPPQALNAYYLPNKNQMGKGHVLKGAGLGGGQVSCLPHLPCSVPCWYPAAHPV